MHAFELRDIARRVADLEFRIRGARSALDRGSERVAISYLDGSKCLDARDRAAVQRARELCARAETVDLSAEADRLEHTLKRCLGAVKSGRLQTAAAMLGQEP